MDYENQKLVEYMYSKRQASELLRHTFDNSRAMQIARDAQCHESMALSVLSHMTQYKRIPIQAMMGILASEFKQDSLEEISRHLEKIVSTGIVRYNRDDHRLIMVYDVAPNIHGLIEQYMYLPPMLVPPLKVHGNRGSGYLTNRNDSLILKDNHHEGELCLDHINRCNSIPLSVNPNVVKAIRNHWKGIDHMRNGETFKDYQMRLDAFDKYERTTYRVIDMLLENGNQFWLTHKYEKRGRTFCQGYHLTYQGNDWNKACLELYEKEIIK